MADLTPISGLGIPGPSPGAAGAPGAASSAARAAAGGPTGEAGGPRFQDYLLESLDKVNALQQQAQDGIERLMTGETDNVSEVLGAVRKADVAFSLLMEIRNKLVDAYVEIRQMRV